MNAEKELLLALLIEKYTIKVVQPVKTNLIPQQRLVSKRKHKPHMWTDWEKKKVIYLRDIEQLSYSEIGKRMNLRAVQCAATYNLLTRVARRAEMQAQNVL